MRRPGMVNMWILPKLIYKWQIKTPIVFGQADFKTCTEQQNSNPGQKSFEKSQVMELEQKE